MEEASDTPMETDVSSTTQDLPVAQDPVSAVAGSLEVTVEVAGTTMEEEELVEEELEGPLPSAEIELQSSPKLDKSEVVIDSTSSEESKPPTPTRVFVSHSPMKGQNVPFKVLSGCSKEMPFKVVVVKKPAAKESSGNISEGPKKTEPSPIKVSPVNAMSENTPEKDVSTVDLSLTEDTLNADSTPAEELSKPPIKENSNEPSHDKSLATIQTPEKLPPSKETSPTVQTENKTALETNTRHEENVVQQNTTANEKELNHSEVDTTGAPSTPQEHSKSKTLTREMQSLIKSAKESKIISECTQITSKIRRSRQLDSSSPITTGGKKVQVRRSSDNSQKSSASEKSEETGRRSMRSQNQEFVAKQKQFLSSVSKIQNEQDEPMSDSESVDGSKIISTPSKEKKIQTTSTKSPDPQRNPPLEVVIEPLENSVTKLRSDAYCWRCHWPVEVEEKSHACCTICPRSFHIKCLTGGERLKATSDKNWVCPECIAILHAEKSDTRSPAMKKITLGMLCDLLRYALQRMSEVNGVEPFLSPVDRKEFPDYDKYVVHPMDLGLMKANIDKGLYGSTEAFIGDVGWILHNSIIFNTLQSKLTSVARALVRSCRAEMGEVEACPECYAAAHARRPTWFTDVCSTPHILLWAKLKGFPYWPAKGMSVNVSGMVDVRFFGAHDRAWVPARDCVLYCEKDPNNFRTKRSDIIASMQEAEQHIRNISRKFGKFVYPPFRVQFEPSKMNEQLKLMIPNFEPEEPAKPREKKKRRSASNSKDDAEASEGEDSPTIRKRKGSSTDPSEKDDDKNGEKITEVTVERSKKRRRSALAEASATVMQTPSPALKRKRLASAEMVILEPSSTPTTQAAKPTDTANETTDEKPATASTTPVHIKKIKASHDKTKSPKPKGSSTPKIVLRSVPIMKTPKSIEKARIKAARREKSFSSDKSEKKKAKHKANKSTGNISMTIRIGDHTEDSIVITNKEKQKPVEAQAKKNTGAENVEKTPPQADTPKTSTKNKNDGEKAGSKPGTPKPNEKKNDDNAPLPTMSKKTNNVVNTNSPSGLPTITDVRSLSMPKSTESNSAEGTKSDADKLQRLRSSEKPAAAFGRVGVRSFARMTSPPKEKQVEVEVKAEPIDLEDAARHSEKLDLMHSFSLRPVNSSSLREVRISKQPQPQKQVAKPAAKEVRPRAKKTFPQPRKADELHSKNSMVYIPIQPPTQAPPRLPSLRVAPSSVSVLRAPVPSLASNNAVNTVTTPMMSIGGPLSATGAAPPPTSGAPTVGQVPTSVHTVPLITSVNGQWTFSLQPVLSVGGADGSPPKSTGGSTMVNGGTERSLVPLPSLSAAEPPAFVIPNPNLEPPKLQQRPLLHPLDPNTPAGELPTPNAAGPLTAKLNRNAAKLADFFRSLLEDSLEVVDDPAAKLAALKMELEQVRWNYKQEISELKHNHELQLVEIRTSFEKERTRAINEVRRSCLNDLEAAVKATKGKQWCANCQQEAQFYCCWNTSYCDYVCQRAHWPNHYAACSQKRPGQGGNGENRVNSGDDRLQPPEMSLGKVSSTNVTVGGKLLPARVLNAASNAGPTPTNNAIIVSMVEDIGSGAQTVKCVGTFKKPNSAGVQTSPRIINKQLINNEDNCPKKVMTSGGYLIVGGPATSSAPVIIN